MRIGNKTYYIKTMCSEEQLAQYGGVVCLSWRWPGPWLITMYEVDPDGCARQKLGDSLILGMMSYQDAQATMRELGTRTKP